MKHLFPLCFFYPVTIYGQQGGSGESWELANTRYQLFLELVWLAVRKSWSVWNTNDLLGAMPTGFWRVEKRQGQWLQQYKPTHHAHLFKNKAELGGMKILTAFMNGESWCVILNVFIAAAESDIFYKELFLETASKKLLFAAQVLSLSVHAICQVHLDSNFSSQKNRP